MHCSNMQTQKLSPFGCTWVLQNVALLWQSVATAAEDKKSESSEKSPKYKQEQQKHAFLLLLQQSRPWLKYLDESFIKIKSLIEK